MFKNKRGAELSLNVIIISIIIIIVLVVVVVFFLGAFGGLSRGTSTFKPDDISIAASACASECQLAQTFDTDIAKRASSYCRKTIKADINGDGVADVKAHCYDSSTINVDCPGIREKYCNANAQEPL